MSLNYTVELPDGQSHTYNASELASQLQDAGYANAQVNPDGKTISYQLNGEMYDDDIPSLLGQQGYKVAGIVPQQADESFVQPTWRAGLDALPSDDKVRKAYIESNLERMGMKGEVVGSGSDWYFHNPDTGKWYATTNAKGFDLADILGAATAAPRVVGSIVGGSVGAAGGSAVMPGLGTVAGGALGSAAGDFAGNRLTRGIASLVDEDYAKVAPRGMAPSSEELKDAALSGVFGGLSGVPALARVLNSGAVTALGKPLGGVTEAAGTLLNKAGGAAARSDLVTGLATAATPGLGTAQAAGLALRAGELLPFLNRAWGKGAGKVAGMADDAIKAGGLSAEEEALAQAIKARGGMARVNAMAREVPKTLEDALPYRMNRSIFGGGIVDDAAKEAVEQGAEEVALNRGAVRGFFENMGARIDRPREMFLQKARQRAAKYTDPAERARFMELAEEQAGRGVQPTFDTIGKVAQAGSRLGRGIEGAAEGVTRAGFRAVQGAGKGLEGAGQALKGGSRFLQPWENRIYMNRGINELDDQAETVQDLMRRRPAATPFSR
jgi:hypothetical protein